MSLKRLVTYMYCFLLLSLTQSFFSHLFGQISVEHTVSYAVKSFLIL